MYRFFKNAKILRYTIDLGVKEGKMKELCSKCLQTEKDYITDIRRYSASDIIHRRKF